MKSDPVLVIMMTVAIFAAYFLPWIIALWRRHQGERGVFWLNLLIGWTFIGWVIALVWALAGRRRGITLTAHYYADPGQAGADARKAAGLDPAPTRSRPRYDRSQRPAKARRV